ncbi:hypothetical protein [Bacillus paranthracis]|uniref:hypothetical protein n=1 Tax=Bacillus paranthracis TaxID=2026186 RepID=UPI0021D0D218|nr:hypothetical protein [Bacillus paranthracis]MCU5173757.1 hypothetical protein [Bacillus paranthracis]
MIVNKAAKEVKGNVVYSYSIKEYPFSPEITEDDMWDNRKFKSLEELLKFTSQELLDEMKEDLGAHCVWVSGISFEAKSEDEETQFRIAMYEDNKVQSWVTTKINDEDISNRAVTNLQRVKEIIDNTLEQYPIKY